MSNPPSGSDKPGRHERHLLRRGLNPLFGSPTRELDSGELAEAQRLDRDEAQRFITELQELVRRAVELEPNESSDVILKLKEDLDKAYEQASGLGGDQSGNREAIRQLLIVIMNAVRQGAGHDARAQAELDDEDEARATHFRLLEIPLIADLLAPSSPIGEDELPATLLSESPDAVAAALLLFDQEQIDALLEAATGLLSSTELNTTQRREAEARLDQIRAARDAMTDPA